VTETDKASEASVIELIREQFPDHAFIAEETAALAPLTDVPTWVCASPPVASPVAY
jgi:fructose-1,6-bisphosphatase/inositol monophosphatase family enzyme